MDGCWHGFGVMILIEGLNGEFTHGQLMGKIEYFILKTALEF